MSRFAEGGVYRVALVAAVAIAAVLLAFATMQLFSERESSGEETAAPLFERRREEEVPMERISLKKGPSSTKESSKPTPDSSLFPSISSKRVSENENAQPNSQKEPSQQKGHPTAFKLPELPRPVDPRLSYEIGPFEKKLPLPPYLQKVPRDYPYVTRSLSPEIAKGKKKVVSLAIHSISTINKHNEYTFGVIENARSLQAAYPGWYLRVYLDDVLFEEPFRSDFRKELQQFEFVEVVTRDDLPVMKKVQARGQRFLVADDPTVDIYLVRDSDSRIIQREIDAVEDWLRSGKKYHSMRDSPWHNHAMMAGAWGGRNDVEGKTVDMTKATLEQLAATDESKPSGLSDEHGDQHFLRDALFNVATDDVYQHDTFHCDKFPNARGFPTRRVGVDIIGMKHNMQGIVHMTHDERLSFWIQKFPNGVPEKCRPAREFLYG